MGQGTMKILAIVGALWASAARAADIHVDASHTGSENGSVQSPFNTIQEAIGAAAISGDTIKVAAGTYDENIIVQEASRTIGLRSSS